MVCCPSGRGLDGYLETRRDLKATSVIGPTSLGCGIPSKEAWKPYKEVNIGHFGGRF